MTTIQIAYIVLWAFVYAYVVRLETIGCKCSADWKRDFIKVYVIFMIPLMLMRLFDLLPRVVLSITFMFTIFFIIVVYRYIHELREIKCKCSEGMTRDVLEIVNYIQIFLLAFAVLLFLMMILFVGKDGLQFKNRTMKATATPKKAVTSIKQKK